jgi:hypothetical protein
MRRVDDNVDGRTLRGNIPGTALVLLINEQDEKEKSRDDRDFSWTSFHWGLAGAERSEGERSQPQRSGAAAKPGADAALASRPDCVSRRLHTLPPFLKAFNYVTAQNFFIWRFRKANLLLKGAVAEVLHLASLELERRGYEEQVF